MSLSSTAASRFLESRIGSHRRVEVYAAAGRREIRRYRWLRSGRTDEQRSKRIRMRARAAQEVSPEMGRVGAADPSSGRGGDLQLRPVRPADRERIVEITNDVWEGRDYIPRVFDSWISDAGASFQAAEIEGEVVGVQRLRPYAPGLVWYEGLRVAAAHRRQGIARAMLAASIEEARGHGFRQIRLATRDLPAVRLFESAGFGRLVEMKWWRGLRVEGGEPARIPDPADARRLWTAVSASPGFELYAGICPDMNGA